MARHLGSDIGAPDGARGPVQDEHFLTRDAICIDHSN